ncbi:MAG: hypothetical protein HQ480_05600 [Candidatus Pelagibacter sp.]|nr:hypothetical protein [Candidatus Pelagibacter sp.]
MENIIGYVIGIPLLFFTAYIILAVPYSTIIKPLYKGVKNKSNRSLISEINKEFLDGWKDFPGSNFSKFIFAVIGLWGWIETALFPSVSPLNDLFYYLWDMGAIMALLGMIMLTGQIACSIFWFPTYAWAIIKATRK